MIRKFGNSLFWIQHAQIRLDDISEHFYQKMPSYVAFCVIYTRLGYPDALEDIREIVAVEAFLKGRVDKLAVLFAMNQNPTSIYS